MKKGKLFTGLICVLLSIAMLGPLIENVQGAQYASGYVRDSTDHSNLSGVYVTIYGRYEYRGRLTSFSRSGYTNGAGRYQIKLPRTTLYTNKMRTFKTGYSTYSGSIKNLLYLPAKDITIRFTGHVCEDRIISNIKRTNLVDVSLDFTNNGAIQGYSNVISDQIIYVRVYDKCNNLLRTVSCDQTTNNYDTGSFTAPAGSIKIEITPIATAFKRYKVFTYSEEFFSSTTVSKNFHLERNCGEVRADGGIGGVYDGFTGHKLSILQGGGDYMPVFWSNLTFGVLSELPKTIVYEPGGNRYSHTYVSTKFDVLGVEYGLSKCIIPGARVSLYVKNCWSNNVDFLDCDRIMYSGDSNFKSADFKMNFQASLGYGVTSSWSSQIQLSASYEQPDGTIIQCNTVSSPAGDWTKLGHIDMDYSHRRRYLNQKMDMAWRIKIDNGDDIGDLFSLYECGSTLQFKVVYEFNVQACSSIIWGYYYGKVIVEQILGDDSTSGVIVSYHPENQYFRFYQVELGDYNAIDNVVNLLAGKSATSVIN